METKERLLEPLLEKIEQYGKTNLNLLKLKSVEKVADISSTIASRIIMIFVLSFFLLSINIAIALWIGDLLGKSYYGFFIISLFYGLMGVALYLFHPSIKTRINNSLIKKVLD